MRQLVVVGAIGAVLVWAGTVAARPAQSLVDVSLGPVFSESVAAGSQPSAFVALQYEWLSSPERVSTVVLLARYLNEPFEPPGHFSFFPDADAARSRGGSDSPRAHFAEGGVGVRTASTRGSVEGFGEFVAGLAVIGYGESGDAGAIASVFGAVRAGAIWQAQSPARLSTTIGLRVYPNADHVAVDAAIGLSFAL